MSNGTVMTLFIWKRSGPLERRIPSHELKRKRVFPSQWAGQLQSVESKPPPGNEKYGAGLRTALMIEVSSTMRATSQPVQTRIRRDNTPISDSALCFDDMHRFLRSQYKQAFNLSAQGSSCAHFRGLYKTYLKNKNSFFCAKMSNLKLTLMYLMV